MRAFSLVCLLLLPSLAPAGSFELKVGDRVVLVGNTLIEREQRDGWWELALTTRYPGKKLVFRNLGWSGDTVFGHARAGFGDVNLGFKELKEHTLGLKPTVILLAYGTNESFEGPDGLPGFTKGLEKLLDTLAPAKARMVVLGPMRQGTMPAPFPDPSKNNRNLRLYADAMRDVAKKRELPYVDLHDLFGDIGKVTPAVTENGIHFTSAGYRWSAPLLEKGLGLSESEWKVEADAAGKSEVGFKRTDDRLPTGPRTLVVKNLPPGKYALTIDDTRVQTADATEWAKGVTFESGPDFAQREKLRQAIISKSELYFHRWRPQNVTYLFGFRKHEQGKNAKEVPQFDPLVEAREKEIATLAIPVERSYKIAR